MKYASAILSSLGCAIASPLSTAPLPTTAPGIRLLPLPIHQITTTNITIPIGGGVIAKWSYYEDQNCGSYIADIESDLDV
jgi:hypothetical protein